MLLLHGILVWLLFQAQSCLLIGLAYCPIAFSLHFDLALIGIYLLLGPHLPNYHGCPVLRQSLLYIAWGPLANFCVPLCHLRRQRRHVPHGQVSLVSRWEESGGLG